VRNTATRTFVVRKSLIYKAPEPTVVKPSKESA